MADVPWIKILTDIFEDEKIQIIQSMPEGESLVLVWIQLLTQAGKTNDGGYIRLNHRTPYTPHMLSVLFRKNQMIVELALRTFEQFGMIEVDGNGFIYLVNWEKHQNVEGLDKIKEQTRLRVQKYRDKKKVEALPVGNVTGNVTVTQSNETDIEEEVEQEKEKIPFVEIVEYLNQRAETKYRPNGALLVKHVTARFNDGFTLADVKTVIDNKVAEWKGTKDEKYLRPETLFGTKFEGYLNQKPISTSIPNNQENIPSWKKKEESVKRYRDIEIEKQRWIDAGNDPESFVPSNSNS